MADWKNFRRGERRQVPDRRQADATPAVPPNDADKPSGRVVHDDRGNAVWDWVKETGRIAIESTSRLLRKLEAPELDFQDEKDRGLSIQSDRDAGGGYDPYNQTKTGKSRRR